MITYTNAACLRHRRGLLGWFSDIRNVSSTFLTLQRSYPIQPSLKSNRPFLTYLGH